MEKEKVIRGLLYALLIFFILSFLTLLTRELPIVNSFFRSLEVQSFDVRENILANFAKQNRFDDSKVALVVIDDDSMDKLTNRYGSWPWNRSSYADIIRYLENDGADSIFLDFINLQLLQCVAKPKSPILI